ncbi:uncharacterized protein TRIVIDRAFT_62594 [Trichoderma virens Gv29-8]|uniref:Uncharacterized protein n=1 Tax=Hypocrea virens (strain Gv29-8 / FGSC 10586) TaxID=413071 RepID=G9MFN4_HYPVG|nr:uncharacterized protein TRIVIDRAFT_62594 [Trichoderma virens Gv29-8]EHK26782.1 hypothetical protein TRIVIDRAFT_62594 [Trichoderma virens Gv29-8]UKZ57236.1 hypothetical protein TrVGV298_011089 [Trichoderma virens]
MAISENGPVTEGEVLSASIAIIHWYRYYPPVLFAAHGWVEPTAFDYTAMAQAQAASTWDSNARIYQWSDEDVGLAFEELEVELFGSAEDRSKHIGGGFDFSSIETKAALGLLQDFAAAPKRCSSIERRNVVTIAC